MGVCNLLTDWDDIGPSSERFTELRDFVNDVLEEWGFDAPNWSDQPLAGHEDAAGVYDTVNDTIHLNPDFLSEASAEDAMNVAVHEGLHAAIDQAGWEMPDFEEEWEAASLGLGVGNEILEGCEEPTESGAPGSLPNYPWVSRGP